MPLPILAFLFSICEILHVTDILIIKRAMQVKGNGKCALDDLALCLRMEICLEIYEGCGAYGQDSYTLSSIM